MTLAIAASSPIGLDLGNRVIRAVQLDRAGEVLASARLLRNKPGEPVGAEDVRRMQGVLYRSGFRGQEVVIAAPKSIIQRTTIDLPPRSSGAPLDQIARSELARQAHLDPDSFEFVWWDAPQPPRHGSAVRAITISCEHEKSGALLDCFEHAGFTPLALLCPSAVIAATIPDPGGDALAAVLDLGWSDATFVVRSRTRIIFERQLSGCGLARSVRAIARKRRIDPDALGREIEQNTASPLMRQLIEHYTHDVADEIRSSVEYLRNCEGVFEPSMISLIGGGAAVPGIAETVARAADIAACAAQGPLGPAASVALALAAPKARFTIGEAA